MINRSLPRLALWGFAIGGACSGALAGCAKTDSADLLTSGIYAAITARATGDGKTTVGAVLYVDDPNRLNFVELTGDDQLIATSGGNHQEMQQVELGNIVSHTAQFSGDAEDSEYTVDFQRTVDDGAPATTVRLPAAFEADDPPASASRAKDLQLTYAPSGTDDRMIWTLSGTCINITSGQLATDSGVLTLPAGSITSPSQPNAVSPTTCAVTLTLSRQRPGTLDPGYGKGGSALGEQNRDLTWSSTP